MNPRSCSLSLCARVVLSEVVTMSFLMMNLLMPLAGYSLPAALRIAFRAVDEDSDGKISRDEAYWTSVWVVSRIRMRSDSKNKLIMKTQESNPISHVNGDSGTSESIDTLTVTDFTPTPVQSPQRGAPPRSAPPPSIHPSSSYDIKLKQRSGAVEVLVADGETYQLFNHPIFQQLKTVWTTDHDHEFVTEEHFVLTCLEIFNSDDFGVAKEELNVDIKSDDAEFSARLWFVIKRFGWNNILPLWRPFLEFSTLICDTRESLALKLCFGPVLLIALALRFALYLIPWFPVVIYYSSTSSAAMADFQLMEIWGPLVIFEILLFVRPDLTIHNLVFYVLEAWCYCPCGEKAPSLDLEERSTIPAWCGSRSARPDTRGILQLSLRRHLALHIPIEFVVQNMLDGSTEVLKRNRWHPETGPRSTQNIIIDMVMPVLGVLAHWLAPGLFRLAEGNPFYPSGSGAAVIAFVNVYAMYPLLLLYRTFGFAIVDLSVIYTDLKYLFTFASPSRARQARLDEFIDLSHGNNLFGWLAARKDVLDRHVPDEFQFNIGVPLLGLVVSLIICTFTWIIILGTEIDSFLLNSVVDMVAAGAFAAAFFVQLARINEILTPGVLRCLHEKKLLLVRGLQTKADPSERRLAKDHAYLIDSTISHLTSSHVDHDALRVFDFAVQMKHVLSLVGILASVAASSLIGLIMSNRH